MKNLACLVTVSLVFAAGCGSDDESVAKRTGTKVGETLTDFAAGMGKGIDKKMVVNVELSKDLADQGLSSTIAKAGGLDTDRPHDPVRPERDLHQSSILVYVIAAKPFKGTLVAKALTKEGQ